MKADWLSDELGSSQDENHWSMLEWMWESEIEARKGIYHEPKLPSMGAIVDDGIADETGGPTDEEDDTNDSIIRKCVWNI